MYWKTQKFQCSPPQSASSSSFWADRAVQHCCWCHVLLLPDVLYPYCHYFLSVFVSDTLSLSLSHSLLFALTCRLAQQGLKFTITMYSHVEIVQLLHPLNLNHFNCCSWSLAIFWRPFIQLPFFFTALIVYFECLEIWRNGTSFSFHFLDEIGNMNFCAALV